MKEKLSISLENYLEQIYLLQLDNKKVRVTDIANSLNHTKPSVNRAINTLGEKEYLVHEHYGNIQLTEKGIKVAENIYETQKIIRKFLIDFLGVEEEAAVLESNQIAYVMTKGTRKKLKKYMKKASKKIQIKS